MLTEENILERAAAVVNMLREANVSLRWMVLHTSSTGSGMTPTLLLLCGVILFV